MNLNVSKGVERWSLWDLKVTESHIRLMALQECTGCLDVLAMAAFYSCIDGSIDASYTQTVQDPVH